MSIIKVENLSKKYIIGHNRNAGGAFKYNSLRDSLSHSARGIYQRLRHPLSPNIEHTELEEFWALKDINFEIKQGDRVGIIGRNGAGKSTLLKILSRITEPTTGKITLNGRVASLLEVGTGFHPELSGRENIYLNGAVLGMTRVEIKKKFDEIVDFSGVEKFLDTPVKRYSSGMYVRLAFAVAAHLEPEILLVDEVLAVGDAEFQKKCLGKMEDVSKQGRTVIFVSHNMGAIKSLCTTTMLLNSGKIVNFDKTRLILPEYLNALKGTLEKYTANENKKMNKPIWISEVITINKNKILKHNFAFEENIYIKTIFFNKKYLYKVAVGLVVNDYAGRKIFTYEYIFKEIQKGRLQCIIKIPRRILVPQKYSFSLALYIPNLSMFDKVEHAGNFEILETGSPLSQYAGTNFGCVFVECKTEIEIIDETSN